MAGYLLENLKEKQGKSILSKKTHCGSFALSSFPLTPSCLNSRFPPNPPGFYSSSKIFTPDYRRVSSSHRKKTHYTSLTKSNLESNLFYSTNCYLSYLATFRHSPAESHLAVQDCQRNKTHGFLTNKCKQSSLEKLPLNKFNMPCPGVLLDANIGKANTAADQEPNSQQLYF